VIAGKKWGFSLLLGVVYLGVFHVWLRSDRGGILVSGLAATVGLTVAWARAARNGYFVNVWDRWAHAAVIADIFVEATLVRFHEGYSFYLCAAAFAVVVGGYRAWALARRRALTLGTSLR